MNVVPMDLFAKVRTDQLVDSTNKCLCCDFTFPKDKAPGKPPANPVGHYMIVHLDTLRAVAAQIDDKAGAGSTPPQTLNAGSGTMSIASTVQPQMNMPSNDRGPSAVGPPHPLVIPPANLALSGTSIKQETCPPDGDDDIVVVFDRAAAPYFVEAQGVGFHLSIRDTKGLTEADVNFLLSILVPPQHAPAANARAGLEFKDLGVHGTRVDVADTGLLSATQLAAVRRVISGTTHDVADAQPQERMNRPSTPRHRPMLMRAPKAAKVKARRMRARKDPNAPKKARTPYTFFVKAFIARMKGSGLQPKEVMKAAAREYKWLDANAAYLLAPFCQQAEEDKVRYRAERAQYLNGR